MGGPRTEQRSHVCTHTDAWARLGLELGLAPHQLRSFPHTQDVPPPGSTDWGPVGSTNSRSYVQASDKQESEPIGRMPWRIPRAPRASDLPPTSLPPAQP